ncbi:hypothetical protein GPECTOR_20g421 [Gonium pectorale]|uniref:Rieske domain-containing protein n=1 Tax=Gonium pectorale TaxID=33097 RepID=A0A150GIB7_GONPE|nr:hypothetical protein GPECTOR_20g421 [Gonium pectorale]|eukprot:KXZ49566.1 hypothetical protein GPECTOR_20g421 [Gonium pectorale]
MTIAAGSGASPLSEANLLALTGEDALEDVKELTLRNHKLQSFDQGDTSRLVNLQVMSLSHNMLSSLAGFQHLRGLVSLNLNFNALTSLEGISSCTALQHLFVANNRIRDISPLVPCSNIQTLHLFRNNIASLDVTMAVLANLPKLRELELAGNPCSLPPEYKHRAVLQLELESLDGDSINQLDYDMANEFFAANGGMPPGLGLQVDILTLEDVDASGGRTAAAAGGIASGSSTGGADTNGRLPSSAVGCAGSKPSTSASESSGPVPGAGAEAQGASDSGGAAAMTVGPGSTAEANGRTAASAWPPLPRPGSAAAARSMPAGPGPSGSAGGLLLPRPGTAMRRPGSACGASGRPGSAYSGLQSSVQLLSNEILNDHPLIIEYLAKNVLMEGLALTDPLRAGSPGSAGASGPGSSSGPGGAGRGPSFAQRLRDTAATMSACEDVDPKELAGQQDGLLATPSTVRLGMAEEMVATASPNELCRQLVRLCEVLIKEVEACRLPVRSALRQSGVSKHAQRVELRVRATEESVEVKPLASTSGSEQSDNWVPVCRPEDLPKGVRKEVEVDGRQVLLFWYRNQICCIEARSPAEGAYSEGFIKAKFTQDYAIECPSTGSLFSLKDGSIVSWYPNNPVLRVLTPSSYCRPMEIYPIKLTQEAIYVDVSAGTLGGVASTRGRGGAGTSVENNNVFTVQPTVYFEGMDPTKEAASLYQDGQTAEPFNPVVLITGIVATGMTAVAGTAFAIYYENLTALIAFWVVFGLAVGVAGFTYVNKQFKSDA